LKNTHLLRCAASLIARRISIYASLFGFLRALHLSIFEQPMHRGVFQNPSQGALPRPATAQVSRTNPVNAMQAKTLARPPLFFWNILFCAVSTS
jgi:hypothetical protein